MRTFWTTALLTAAITFVACSSDENSDENNETSGPLALTTVNNGKVVVDSETGLTWVNETLDACQVITIDSTISAAVMQASDFCDTLDHAGSMNWRLATADEMVDFVEKTADQNLTLEYITPGCANVLAETAIVKTENTDTPGTTITMDPSGEAGAGARCVTEDL